MGRRANVEVCGKNIARANNCNNNGGTACISYGDFVLGVCDRIRRICAQHRAQPLSHSVRAHLEEVAGQVVLKVLQKHDGRIPQSVRICGCGCARVYIRVCMCVCVCTRAACVRAAPVCVCARAMSASANIGRKLAVALRPSRYILL